MQTRTEVLEELVELVSAIEMLDKWVLCIGGEPDSKTCKDGVVDESRTEVSQSSRTVETWILI